MATERHHAEAEHQRELNERRVLWEAQRKQQREQREREEKQHRLAAHLKRRADAWQDHTGAMPPADVMAGWQSEYIAARAVEEEQEREARLQAAESASTI